MHYLIYKVTNKLNNRFYVGKHKTENRDDDYLGSGILIKRAIKKYGKENFVKELLFECATEEEMNQRETDIVDADFVAREDTYNVAVGGDGGNLTMEQKLMGLTRARSAFLKRLEEDLEFRAAYCLKRSHIAKMRNLKYGNPSKGKRLSDETRRKMSVAHIGKTVGSSNGVFGKHWVTNGQENKMVENTFIPDGWRKGRTL